MAAPLLHLVDDTSVERIPTASMLDSSAYADELHALRQRLSPYMTCRLSEKGKEAVGGILDLIHKVEQGEDLTAQDTFKAQEHNTDFLGLAVETRALIDAYLRHQEASRQQPSDFEAARDELRFAYGLLDQKVQRYLEVPGVKRKDDLIYISYLAESMKRGSSIEPEQLREARDAIDFFQLGPDFTYLLDSYVQYTEILDSRDSRRLPEETVMIGGGYELHLALLGAGIEHPQASYPEVTLDWPDDPAVDATPAPEPQDGFEITIEEMLVGEALKPAPVADDVVLFKTGLPEDTVDDMLSVMKAMGIDGPTGEDYEEIAITYDAPSADGRDDDVPQPEDVTFDIDDIPEAYDIEMGDIEDAQLDLLLANLTRMRKERYSLMGLDGAYDVARLELEVMQHIFRKGGLDSRLAIVQQEREELEAQRRLYQELQGIKELTVENGVMFSLPEGASLIGSYMR